MFMLRNYDDESPRDDAADIAAECIVDGSSEGWAGPAEAQRAVEAILDPLGIKCVDNRGRWVVCT